MCRNRSSSLGTTGRAGARVFGLSVAGWGPVGAAVLEPLLPPTVSLA